jgi:hypothetical protein
MVDDFGKLQDNLVEISADQAAPANRQDVLGDLVKKINDFSISDPTRTLNQLTQLESYSETTRLPESTLQPSTKTQFSSRKICKIFQDFSSHRIFDTCMKH